MAIIYCPDCHKEMSDTATVCPNCGYPYAQKLALYHRARQFMESCSSGDGYLGLSEVFNSISGVLDSKEQSRVCYDKAKALDAQSAMGIQKAAERQKQAAEELKEKQIRKKLKRKAFIQKYKIPIFGIVLIAGILLITTPQFQYILKSKGAASIRDTISAKNVNTVGLKSDGTVVVAGQNTANQCDVLDWSDIVEVAAGGNYTVGLKSDGTVIAAGNNSDGQCDVLDWKYILEIAAGNNHTIGLKSDGTVVST